MFLYNATVDFRILYSNIMALYYDAKRFVVALLICIMLLAVGIDCIGEVIWAVNCGGDTHTDIHGVRYQKDMLIDGVASDYGKNMLIQRVLPQDQILYQTERYHTDTFGYEVPIRQDGDYVLVLKFSEVWFAAHNQKVTLALPQHWHQSLIASESTLSSLYSKSYNHAAFYLASF